MRLFSFQRTRDGKDPEPVPDRIVALENQDSTILDTAAALVAMDLVITVDTMVCHLVGALGVPTCTLLPYRPDWRWFLKREDTPWYPTMRLFRQPKPNDWQDVIDRVVRELSKFPGGHSFPLGSGQGR